MLLICRYCGDVLVHMMDRELLSLILKLVLDRLLGCMSAVSSRMLRWVSPFSAPFLSFSNSWWLAMLAPTVNWTCNYLVFFVLVYMVGIIEEIRHPAHDTQITLSKFLGRARIMFDHLNFILVVLTAQMVSWEVTLWFRRLYWFLVCILFVQDFMLFLYQLNCFDTEDYFALGKPILEELFDSYLRTVTELVHQKSVHAFHKSIVILCIELKSFWRYKCSYFLRVN